MSTAISTFSCLVARIEGLLGLGWRPVRLLVSPSLFERFLAELTSPHRYSEFSATRAEFMGIPVVVDAAAPEDEPWIAVERTTRP
jgi:hypothetical protein